MPDNSLDCVVIGAGPAGLQLGWTSREVHIESLRDFFARRTARATV